MVAEKVRNEIEGIETQLAPVIGPVLFKETNMSNDLVAKLGVDATGWNAGFAQARSTASSFGSSIGSIASSLASPLGAAAAAGAAALGAMWGAGASTGAFKESLEAQRKLSAVIEATGGAAGLTTEDITSFAAEMQSLTNFEDDATTASAAVLAAFTNIRGQTFTDTIESAMDLTTVMGGELTDNVKLLGKALNDPIDGVKKLAKAGVQLTQAQEQEVEALQKSGDMMGAQQVLLDALQSKFGGAAMAVADPWKQLQNTFGDVAENIGSLLLPTIDLVSGLVSGWLGPIAESGDAFLDFGTSVAANLEVAIGMIGEYGQTFVTAISQAVDYGISCFNSLWEMIGLGGVSFQDLLTATMVAFQNIGGLIVLGIDQWSLFFVKIGLDAAYYFTDVIPGYVSWFTNNFDEIIDASIHNALQAFENLGSNISAIWQGVLNFFKTGEFNFDFTPMTKGMIQEISKMPDIAPRAISEMEKGLESSIAASAENLGEAFSTGFAKTSSDFGASKEKWTQHFDTASKVPAGMMVDDAEGKDHEKKTREKKSQSTAALIGSKEAASAFTRGLGTEKDETPKKIDKSNEYLKTIAGAVSKGSQNTGQPMMVANFGRP